MGASHESSPDVASLPLTRSTEGFTLCHGSLRDPLWEYVTTTPIAAASLALAPTPHACNGHTHVPAFFVEAEHGLEAHQPVVDTPYSLAPRCVLNPGSVGQPRDGDARAAYVVLDTTAATVTFRRVVYPVAETQKRIRARALPEMFADRLSLGL